MSALPAQRRARYKRPAYSCLTCDKEIEIPLYVRSSWFKPILHTCDACFALHELTEGVATLKAKGNITR